MLQWRAEQLLRQTCRAVMVVRDLNIASMEGRAIAPPNPGDGTGIGGASRYFNGGPSNCSAKLDLVAGLAVNGDVASMEGRAIAPPNQWRGQVSCLAPLVLQWRAEQLLGQTVYLLREILAVLDASMEGRTIARPNWDRSSIEPRFMYWLQWRAEQLLGQTRRRRRRTAQCRPRFNGGPSNCSAKRGLRAARRCWPNFRFQWRAEQLLGQTASCSSTFRPRPPGFNGGPSNCSAKPARSSPSSRTS